LVFAVKVAGATGRATTNNVLPEAENAALKPQLFTRKLDSVKEIVPVGKNIKNGTV